jgi:hypothetical protein
MNIHFRFRLGNLKLMWSCWLEDIDESEKDLDLFYFHAPYHNEIKKKKKVQLTL